MNGFAGGTSSAQRCPTCGSEKLLVLQDARNYGWCETCGTLFVRHADHIQAMQPHWAVERALHKRVGDGRSVPYIVPR